MPVKNLYGGSPEFRADEVLVTNRTTTTGGKISLKEGADNGTSKVTIKAPDTLASDVVLTLPSSTGTLVTTGGTDLTVPDGGTGVSSLTAYSVVCGGTTSTGAVQSVASVGTSGHVLTSNGAGALPTFQAAAGGGGMWTPAANGTQSGDSITFTGLSVATPYRFRVENLNVSTAATVYIEFSIDNGSNWLAAGEGTYHQNGRRTATTVATANTNASALQLTIDSTTTMDSTSCFCGEFDLFTGAGSGGGFYMRGFGTHMDSTGIYTSANYAFFADAGTSQQITAIRFWSNAGTLTASVATRYTLNIA